MLRQKAKLVRDITDSTIQTLIDDMLDTVTDSQGVGIAAPQISHSLQIFVMASHPNSRYPHAPHMPATAIINPRIIWQSAQYVDEWEGCLSVPQIRGLVSRANKIRVCYMSRENTRIETEYSGFLARIFQHEYDHLIGRIFIDRVRSMQDLMSENEWRSQILGEEFLE